MITLKEEVCFCCFPVCCFCFCFSLREDGGFCCFPTLPFCRLLQANAADGDENGGDAQPLSPKAPGGCPPTVAGPKLSPAHQRDVVRPGVIVRRWGPS